MFVIVTPCRRYNIPEILYRNLKPWTKKYDIEWLIIYDTFSKIVNKDLDEPWIKQFCYRNPESEGGHDQLNYSFSLFDKGMFFALDDDTVMHPRFFPAITEYAERTGKTGFLFHDQLKNDEIFPAYPHNIKACVVGQQNFALDRKLVGDRRYDLPYISDGMFIEKLYNDCPNDFCFIDEVLAYHNRLRKSNWEDYV
jgi:hypothetical protein